MPTPQWVPSRDLRVDEHRRMRPLGLRSSAARRLRRATRYAVYQLANFGRHGGRPVIRSREFMPAQIL